MTTLITAAKETTASETSYGLAKINNLRLYFVIVVIVKPSFNCNAEAFSTERTR